MQGPPEANLFQQLDVIAPVAQYCDRMLFELPNGDSGDVLIPLQVRDVPDSMKMRCRVHNLAPGKYCHWRCGDLVDVLQLSRRRQFAYCLNERLSVPLWIDVEDLIFLENSQPAESRVFYAMNNSLDGSYFAALGYLLVDMSSQMLLLKDFETQSLFWAPMQDFAERMDCPEEWKATSDFEAEEVKKGETVFVLARSPDGLSFLVNRSNGFPAWVPKFVISEINHGEEQAVLSENEGLSDYDDWGAVDTELDQSWTTT
eukprot:TRINITY_DN4150_c0_g1_i1.p1 TRINITY_DN4150_c0_g1~~TRINITY_DN4150_c0_g1_i1.p1  ORF type:complete len:258 (-),score=44.58 TRINITY_DN4150_c0_g1_i1:200-973(-)